MSNESTGEVLVTRYSLPNHPNEQALVLVFMFFLDSQYFIFDGKEGLHHLRVKVASLALFDKGEGFFQ